MQIPRLAVTPFTLNHGNRQEHFAMIRVRHDPCSAYMMRGDGRGAKRLAIELGVRTMDRIVDGPYEWRDAGLRATPKE